MSQLAQQISEFHSSPFFQLISRGAKHRLIGMLISKDVYSTGLDLLVTGSID